MIGIYYIKCKINNKVYIGSSINIEQTINILKSCKTNKPYKGLIFKFKPQLTINWVKKGRSRDR